MESIFNKYKIFLFMLALINCQFAYSQQKVHVLTKTIKKELKSMDKTLLIKGEKSTINVNSWEKDFYAVEIKLISKNLNKKHAERDLSIIKYQITETNSNYLIKNQFVSDKFSKVKSNLSAIYTIKVPKAAQLGITNIYGNIYLKNLNATVKVKNSFGEIHVSQVSGIFTISSYYSDIWMDDVDLKLTCIADKSDIYLSNISGTLLLKSNYGKANLTAGKYLKKLEIDAKRTTISFKADVLNKYNYSLSTQSSKISLPKLWQGQQTKESGKIQFHKINNKDNPLIKIKTTYCEVSIKN